MRRRREGRYGRQRSHGAVLLWALLASSGMVVMTAVTFDAMLLQLTDWHAEREHVIVRHAARALLVRCEAQQQSIRTPVMTVPDTVLNASLAIPRRSPAEPGCDEAAAWRPLHDLMRTTQRPARWRDRLALATQAAGTRDLTWTVASPAVGRSKSHHSAQVIVDAVCLPERWVDDATLGRVEVLTVRAQMRHARKGDTLKQSEEGLWLQSIVARRPVPCRQTVRVMREIVEPGRRGITPR